MPCTSQNVNIHLFSHSSTLVCNMTSLSILASGSVSCAVDLLHFIIMRRIDTILKIGIHLLRFYLICHLNDILKSPSERKPSVYVNSYKPLDRLFHILTYHAVCYVLLHAYNEWYVIYLVFYIIKLIVAF